MKICVVLVTYNRLEKLKTCLRCFDNQTYYPCEIVVVDNASTDGTPKYLNDWKNSKTSYKKTIITNNENLGGSGGFYAGLNYAIDSNCDWIWVSDDDAYPDSRALEFANNFLINNENKNISAICGTVLNKNKISYAHRTHYYSNGIKIKVDNCLDEDYKKESFELNGFSYVGTIININKLKKVGLTEKDYFIWLDDTEHSIRLSKVGTILCIPSIKINHDVDESNNDLSWKDYYGYRNRIHMYSIHFRGLPYYLFIFKRMIKSIHLLMFAKNKEYAKLYNQALIDGINKKLGKHDLYKPGWNPKNKKKI